MLAHHKRPLQVTSNGITLRFGKQVYNYRNEQTGHLRGQTVLGWFDPELPEILTVTDMNRENPFCVERTQEVPAMDAPAELIEQEMARINAHMSYGRVRYRTLKARFSVTFRRAVADSKTVALGVQIAEQQDKIETRRADEQKRQTRAKKTFSRLGMNTPRETRPGQIEAAERLNQLLNEEETTQGMKDYFLKPSGGQRTAYIEYLLNRLTEFRRAGHNHHGEVSVHVTRKIIQSQLAWPLDDEARFEETCAHIKAKIDDTILGRRNRAKGVPNYHAFEDHGKPKPAKPKPAGAASGRPLSG